MNNQKLAPHQRFRDNVIGLSHYCKVIINKASETGHVHMLLPGFVNAGITMLEKQCTKEEMIKMIDDFVIKSHQNWHQIKLKNEDFFDKNSSEIFASSSSPDVVQMFRTLFFTTLPDGNPLITSAQKDYVWNALHSLVKISIQHVHESREPHKLSDGSIEYHQPMRMGYVDNLHDLINEWEIRDKLRFKNL